MPADEFLHTRPVRLSEAFVTKAQSLFPAGGSAGGAPSYELFLETVCAAAHLKFGRDFEGCDVVDGIGIVLTAETEVFRRPLAFYARLVDDDTVVEMIDVEIDLDWIDIDLELNEEGD